MSPTAAERRQVFACKRKAIFSGPDALLRKPKTITKRSVIAKELLKDGVFESDIKAQLVFPDLLAPSTANEREHKYFEDKAACAEAKTVKEAESVCEREKSEIKQSPSISLFLKVDASMEEETPINQGITSIPLPPPSAEPELKAPSLYPSCFPYHAQHSILSQVQQVLEESCFDFTKKWLPLELERHGWDCAAAVELTKWTNHLMKWSPQLPDGSLQSSGPEFHARLAKVSGIRHCISAMRLTEALRDTLRTSQLESLHLDIQAKIKAMEFSKNALEEELSRELEAIQRQREELDKKEVELQAKTIANDNEVKVLMGLLVKKSIERIFCGGTYEDSLTGVVTADMKAEGD
ncbi:hypothetical protein AARAC_008508 [Aspergillus arachidicola]|uniref:Ubiquinol-cytochrome-c reductase cytochrome c1 n=1 Tax=Aspergillus arachidicola TaxID=656916 RepID=A0A2G7FTL8_9EURO|nr:hypothetical protein AARAC_008508 [Aspergillus arachidicola]